uniref:Uncharacterized protein n=1 Tax=Setaria italica TaxID=4555 RepID=K3XZW0_SETIT
MKQRITTHVLRMVNWSYVYTDTRTYILLYMSKFEKKKEASNQPDVGGGHPPLELFVWHDGAAPSCCRYSRRRSWRMCSPETTASPGPKPPSPPSGRAELDVTRNAMIVAVKTTATTNFDIVIDHVQVSNRFSSVPLACLC